MQLTFLQNLVWLAKTCRVGLKELSLLTCRARESLLHVLAEQHAWLSKYCAEPKDSGDASNGAQKAEQAEPVLSKL